MLRVIPYLKEIIYSNPFTYPAYVKSIKCSLNSSGLALTIADEKGSNDASKIENFVESPNWDFYVSACNEYGFMVDKHNPWRIVADIASAEMLEYARKYNVYTTDQVLAVGYEHAHQKYLTTFRNILYNMYMNTKKKAYTQYMEVGSKGERIVRRSPRTYTLSDFETEYPSIYFLKFYCELRFLEEESQFSEAEQFQLIDNILELSQRSTTRALYIFETILNKTFDYNGSLTYINERLKKLRV